MEALHVETARENITFLTSLSKTIVIAYFPHQHLYFTFLSSLRGRLGQTFLHIPEAYAPSGAEGGHGHTSTNVERHEAFTKLSHKLPLPQFSTMLFRSRGVIAFLCILALSTVALVGHLFSRRGVPAAEWIPAFKSQPEKQCLDKLDWLASLDIAYPVRYARRNVVLNPISDLKRASTTKIDGPLFSESQDIDLTEKNDVKLKHCKKPLVLDVPAPADNPGDASHVIFGISTTLQRLDESIPQLLRWLPNTYAKLIAIVIEKEQVGEAEGVEQADAIAADPMKTEELQNRMRDLEMDVTLVDPLGLQDMFSEKYFSLIKIMYENRTDKTLWLSLLDDDTFFPSMSALLSMLAKYNAHEEYYVGGLSENWWSVTHYGMMAFGGAGIFLSIALAEVLVSNYDVCIDSSYANAGDIRVMECIYVVTETKLTNERDLHQIDVHGDLSGIYESGRMPLSLHHWKAGGIDDKGYNLPQMSLISDLCGDCFLQRWQIGADMVLTNGFSISLYAKGSLKDIDMEEMEETWNETPNVEGSNNRGVDHSLAPIRRKMILDEEKIQYRLIASASLDGGVRQAYLHTGVDGEMDSLFELFWTESKAPEDLS